TGLSGLTHAPDSLTEEGVIVGTLHYMAPEQLEGKDTDARTDLFAFGVVLYEMVTGRKPFEGTSGASIVAAILQSQAPAISTLRPVTPPALEHVVTTCLGKDPDEQGSLWVRTLDSLAAQKLPGTEDATFPFWSPDSQTVAFFAQKKLKKISAWGGVVQTLCDSPGGRGGTWNRDGVIVFAPLGLG